MYIRICGSTCANMVPGCSRPDDTRKHCPIARCPQRHPYANDTAHRPADSAAAPLPLPLAAATTTATTAATAAAAMLASVDVDAAASEDWSWARNVTCCEAADTRGRELVCALAGAVCSSGFTGRPAAFDGCARRHSLIRRRRARRRRAQAGCPLLRRASACSSRRYRHQSLQAHPRLASQL